MNCINVSKSEKHPGLIECRDISDKMTYPSEFVKKLVHVCEIVLSQELAKNWMGKKYFFDRSPPPPSKYSRAELRSLSLQKDMQ